MEVSLLSPLGARVTGIDLGALDAGQVSRLSSLLAERGVLILPGQPIGDETFLAFLRSFGPLAFTVGETPVEGFPDLNVISNVGRAAPPRSNFHVDTSYVASPPAYTALRAVQVPEVGGETLFTNQYHAHDTLAPDLRDRLAGRRITHVVTGLDLGPEEERSADHPVFRVHPISGRTSLYLSTPARCAAISGLSPSETESVVAQLYEHSTRAENTLRHSWSPADVVIWDNRCVLHRADHSGVEGDRVMHRGMVAAPAGSRAAA